jgi:hypothetical protein
MAAKKPMEEGRGARLKGPRASLSFGLYRLCLAPVLAAVLILAFSLGSPSSPLGSSLIPEAFEGAHAFDRLAQMAKVAPSRRLGSRGDVRLLEYLRSQLSSLGSPSNGGYTLAVHTIAGETTAGSMPQTLLIGLRAGTGTQPPIALIASRDSTVRGARAQLSGVAALLEIASVLAQGETEHPIYVIFSDGASNGDAAIVSWLQSALGDRLDAALALGDLAGARLDRPLVQPFSNGFGLAPEVLTGTVSSALQGTMGVSPGRPSLLSQLAHLAFPLSVGQQGPLNAIGIPSVSVSLAGERGPSAGEPVSQSRLQATGRGLLNAFYALDRGGEVSRARSTGLRLSGRVLPQWPIALLILTLLLGPLLASGDALVRLVRGRRRRVRRWMLLPLLCAWPFALCAVSLKLLSLVGLLHSPPNPVGASALGFDAGSVAALILALAVLVGCWWAWRRLTTASSPRKVPPSGVAGVASLFIGCLLALLVWLLDPYASLLLIPALHAWLIAVSPRHRPRKRPALLALLLIPALAPLALLLTFYALWLGLGPSQMLLEGMVMVGGGYVSLGGVLIWSIAFGLLVAMGIATLGANASAAPPVHPPPEERLPVLYPSRAPVYRERVLR